MLNSRSGPPLRAALRAEVDLLEQVISPSERTTLDLVPVLPVAHAHGLVEVPQLDEVRGTDFLDLTVGPVRDALADKEFSPRRWGWCNAPRTECKLVTLVWNFMSIHGLDHL